MNKTKAELIEEILRLQKEVKFQRSYKSPKTQISDDQKKYLFDYKELFDNMLNGFALHETIRDEKGKPIDFEYIAVNEAFGKQTGFDISEIIGKTILQILPGIDLELIEKYASVIETGRSIRFIQYAQPLSKYYDVHAFLFKDEFLAVAFNDITDHHSLMISLKTAEERYEIATGTARTGVFEWNIKNGTFYLDKVIKDFTGYTDDELPNVLDEWIKLIHPDEVDYVSKKIYANIYNEDEINDFLRYRVRHKDGSYIYVRVTGRMILDERDKPEKIIGTISDITQDVLLEQELTKSKEKYVDLFKSAPDAIFIADIESGIILDANEAAVRLLKKPLSDIIGMHQLDLHPKEIHAAAKADFDQGKNNKKEDFDPIEIPVVDGNGDNIIVELTATRTEFNGKPALLGYFRDLTSRKEAEREIRKSEEKFRMLAENASDVITMFDNDGVCTYASPSVKQILGIDGDELVGSKGILNVHKDDVRLIEQANERLLQKGIVKGVEVRYKRNDGSYIWLDTTSKMIFDDNEEPLGIISISRDIQDKKLAQIGLEENEALLKETGRLAKVGGWKRISDDNLLHLSDTSKNIFDLSNNEIYLDDLINCFTEKHRNLIKESFELLFDVNHSFDIVVETNRMCAGTKWIRLIGNHESQNNVDKYHGTFQDITEQKNIEDALISERERLDVTLKSIGDGVITTDRESKVVMMNKVAEKLTGWTSFEAAGKEFDAVFNVFNEETGEKALNPVEEVLKYNVSVGIENNTVLISKDGAKSIISDSASPIQNSRGEVIGVVLVFRDVTEHKRTEDQILNQNKLLNAINRLFEKSMTNIDQNSIPGLCLESAMELTNAEIGFIGLINDNKRFDTLDYRGYDPKKYGLTEDNVRNLTKNAKLRGLRGYVYESGTGFYTNDPVNHPKSSGVPKWHRKVNSFLGYPVLEKDKVIALIGLANKKKGFDDVDLENVKYLSYAFYSVFRRNKFEVELKESEERYRLLIEMAPVPMIIHDYETIFYSNSQAIEALRGSSHDELMKLSIWDILTKETHSEARNSMDLLFDKGGTTPLYEQRFVCLDGKEITIEMKATIIEYVGKKAFLVAFQDITDRKKYQDALKNSEVKLKEAINSKDKFFDIIAHDLRSPILGFLGLSESLAKNFYHISMNEMQEMSNALYKSSFNLNRLLENLLEWSRTQTGKTKTNLQSYDIYDSVIECLELNSTNAEKKGIHLLNNVEQGTYVYSDRKMIYTVLRNLVNNAIKFTDKNGKVEIHSIIRDNMVEVSVSDSGVGIKPENFDKLFRIDETFSTFGTQKEKGTGLGLILVKEFVQKNNGEIWLKSEPDKGTTFTFSLPLSKKSDHKE